MSVGAGVGADELLPPSWIAVKKVEYDTVGALVVGGPDGRRAGRNAAKKLPMGGMAWMGTADGADPVGGGRLKSVCIVGLVGVGTGVGGFNPKIF